jgi:imidazolonepropionase-like amidohydrolase
MMPISPDLLPTERRAAYRASVRPGTFAFFEWYEAVDLRAPEIAHMLSLLADRRVHVDATLVAFLAAFWGDDPAVREWRLDLVHPIMVANWRTFRFDAGWTPADYARAKAVWPKVLEMTRRMHEAGVPMTIGDDFGNPYVAPGASVAREMALHVEAGIPAWAVLRMATCNAADILRIGDRTGRIARGLEADVVFLTADPAADVMNAARVHAVLNNGRFLPAEDLRGGRVE